MPPININWLRRYLRNINVNKHYPIFIETGTFMGNTIIPLENYFRELHTIEIKEEFYDKVKNNYNKYKSTNEKRINFHLGDSAEVLADLCPKIKNNTIFFLDGHWSSGNTGKGNKDVPIYEELQNIMEHLKYNCIIIIDDCRLFGKGPNKGNCNEDWENINTQKILDTVRPRLVNYFFAPSQLFYKDRLIIFLRN